MAGILLEGDHVTDEERAAHACALAAKEREKSSGITRGNRQNGRLARRGGVRHGDQQRKNVISNLGIEVVLINPEPRPSICHRRFRIRRRYAPAVHGDDRLQPERR